MIRKYLVTITHSGDTPEEFDGLFIPYITDSDFPFRGDYDAWAEGTVRGDGYDGPFTLDVTCVPLTCTSDDPNNHQGDTCPIHEIEEA